MDIAGSVVVIFIAWWIALQALLSIGVQSQAEAEGEGHRPIGDPGAPMQPNIWRKGFWAFGIALVVWGILFSLIHWSGLTFEDLPSF